MKPIIGIIPDYNSEPGKTPIFFLKENYAEAIADNGGTPYILPILKQGSATECLNNIKGLLLTGGDSDIDPKYFRQTPHPRLGRISQERTLFELKVYKEALKKNIPILGICRGMQLINVAEKGDLIQDIPSFLPNSSPHENSEHRINISPGSKLEKIMGKKTITVRSFHHQAVDKTGKRFQINCRSEDNIIEGIEDPNHPFLIALQWHPERFYRENKSVKNIFKAFIQAAKIHK